MFGSREASRGWRFEQKWHTIPACWEISFSSLNFFRNIWAQLLFGLFWVVDPFQAEVILITIWWWWQWQWRRRRWWRQRWWRWWRWRWRRWRRWRCCWGLRGRAAAKMLLLRSNGLRSPNTASGLTFLCASRSSGKSSWSSIDLLLFWCLKMFCITIIQM